MVLSFPQVCRCRPREGFDHRGAETVFLPRCLREDTPARNSHRPDAAAHFCTTACALKVGDIHQRAGVVHLRVEGKGDKVRYLLLHVLAQRLIRVYLDAAGHRDDLKGPLFRPAARRHGGRP